MKSELKKVFVVHHEYYKDGYDRLKFIGVFISKSKAKCAIQAMKKLPGFSKWPKGFLIQECELGSCEWTHGFGPSEKLLKLVEEADTAESLKEKHSDL